MLLCYIFYDISKQQENEIYKRTESTLVPESKKFRQIRVETFDDDAELQMAIWRQFVRNVKDEDSESVVTEAAKQKPFLPMGGMESTPQTFET